MKKPYITLEEALAVREEGRKSETNYILILNDKKTGAPKAILPAGMLTTYRTAAVSAYATMRLKKGIHTLGIIGPGKINLAYTEWMIKHYPQIKVIKIKGRGKQKIYEFINSVKDIVNSKGIFGLLCC